MGACGDSYSPNLPEDPTKSLGFSLDSVSLTDIDCQKVFISTLENINTEIIRSQPVTIELFPEDGVKTFSDESCLREANQVVINEGESRTPVYIGGVSGGQFRVVAAEIPARSWQPAMLDVLVNYSLVGTWRVLCQVLGNNSQYTTTEYEFFHDNTYRQTIISFASDGTCQHEDYTLALSGDYQVGDYLPGAAETRGIKLSPDSILWSNGPTSWSLRPDCNHQWIEGLPRDLLEAGNCRPNNSNAVIYDIYRAVGGVITFGAETETYDLTSAERRPVNLSADPVKTGRRIK